MPLLRRPAVRHHLLGLGCVAAGAGLTDATGSLLPLALGSAVAVMTLVALLRDQRSRAAARRNR